MPRGRIVAYETTATCDEDGGPVVAIVDQNGDFIFNTPDYIQGECTSCHRTSGVSQMKVDKSSPIYENED